MTLTGPGGSLSGTVSYDGATQSATFVPAAPLALQAIYTATASPAIRAVDGSPLDGVSWTFTTAATPPPSPVASGLMPADGTTRVSNGAQPQATFDIALDPNTVTTQTFTLTPDGGSPVAASVSYDAAARRATLVPAAPLGTGVHYTARLTTGIRSTTGAPLGSTVTWGFTTANCPCSLMPQFEPQYTGLPVRDFRPGTGPWTYELGTKITPSADVRLIALRYYKSPGETGTHVGRLWSSTGTQIASVTFQNESASGWQRQALNTPVNLTAGTTYTVSVGFNAFFSRTYLGLQSQVVSGPLRSVADGQNGVYADSAGQFPTSSWGSSNYFVDAVVNLPNNPSVTPAVSSVTPTAGATGVAPGSDVRAVFASPLDSGSVNGATFTLTGADGVQVPATVGYDETTTTATLDPSSPLETGMTYTARLTTGIRSDDETPMPAAYTWTFTTIPPVPPAVTLTSPSDGAGNVAPSTNVTATFSESMNASTLNTTTFTLTPAGGSPVPAAVTYDAATRTATLNPTGSLDPAVTYTARITTGARSTRDLPLQQQAQWQFTTWACPCSLFGSAAPDVTHSGLETRNWRSGTGPFTLELGTKIRVTQAAELTRVRFWKDAQETGTHVGRVWSSTGTLLASVTFTNETAGAGWQEQELATPLNLAPGQTYVVSVGFNAYFGSSPNVLFNEVVSGPLRSVADGQNGVFADDAGVFPTQSWASSSYWVDAVVR
jgi:hypothetical protein